MPIVRGLIPIEALTGIPRTHQTAFQRVSNAENCIIMCRAVGTACTQLIEEGYASKGFHISDRDLPVFAVLPGQALGFCLSTVADLREFINIHAVGYVPFLNPGWMDELRGNGRHAAGTVPFSHQLRMQRVLRGI
ncbi:hypothetical protein FMN50_18990 [Rhodobacterales bacterium]|nr:hypothetical protein FMN50_18990 [Rhodobacterales bacterium]